MNLEKLRKLEQELINITTGKAPFFIQTIRDFLAYTKYMEKDLKGYYSFQRIIVRFEPDGDLREITDCGIINPNSKQHASFSRELLSLTQQAIRESKYYI